MTLSRDDVVRGAMAVLAADGAAALSMRRVARELGAGTMSLYNHVENRGDLVDAICESFLRWNTEEPGTLGERALRLFHAYRQWPFMTELLREASPHIARRAADVVVAAVTASASPGGADPEPAHAPAPPQNAATTGPPGDAATTGPPGDAAVPAAQEPAGTPTRPSSRPAGVHGARTPAELRAREDWIVLSTLAAGLAEITDADGIDAEVALGRVLSTLAGL